MRNVFAPCQYPEPQSLDRISSAPETWYGALAEVSSLGRVTHSYLSWIFLFLCIADRPILLDDHGPTSIPVSHARHPAYLLREKGLGVGEEQDLL